MIVRTTTQRPVEFTVSFLDRQIVDAGVTYLHQTVFAKFPVFIAVRAEPVAGVVMPFVSVAYGDTVIAVSPQFLDQTVIEFFGPFAFKKGLRFFAALDEFSTVAPFGIHAVGEGEDRKSVV